MKNWATIAISLKKLEKRAISGAWWDQEELGKPDFGITIREGKVVDMLKIFRQNGEPQHV